MANWDNPTTASLYVDFITELKARDADLATMFSGSPTNIITDTVKWNAASDKFEIYNGASWDDLSTKFLINVDTIDSLHSTDITQDAFKTIVVATQTDLVADDPHDTLTLVAGTGLTITTTPASDSVAFTVNQGALTLDSIGGTLGIAKGGTGSNTAGDARTAFGLVIGSDVQAHDADTAKTDVAQDWTAQQSIGEVELTDGTTIAWDLDAAQEAKVTIAANRTLSNPTNQNDGGWYHVRVIQGTGGSRLLSYGTNYKFGDAGAPTLSIAVSAEDVLSFRSNGTYMQYMGASLGVQA